MNMFRFFAVLHAVNVAFLAWVYTLPGGNPFVDNLLLLFIGLNLWRIVVCWKESNEFDRK